MKDPFTVQTAQQAAAQGKLREWTINFLEDHGNNLKLAAALRENTGIKVEGPEEAVLAPMKRITGSPEERLMYTDTQWEENIQKMVSSIKDGWTPPPLIWTDYWDKKDGNLTDGNHRFEALKRLGYTKYWTIYLRNPQ